MEQVTEDIIHPDSVQTLDGLFRERVRRSGPENAYKFYRDKGWRESTWAEVGQQVEHWQRALQADDLQPGDRVAILCANSVEWVVMEQASLGLGLVVVPLYTDDRPDNVAYILEDAAVSMIFVGSSTLWKRFGEALIEVDCLQRILLLEPVAENPADAGDPRVRVVREWLQQGGDSVRYHDRGCDELATIVYTSGTTGRPKGVMLSHRNILSNAHAALLMFDIYPDDQTLSFLPLSHTFERTVGYYLFIMSGARVAYNRSIPLLAEDIKQVRPTKMICVPRIFERIYSKMQQQLQKGPAIKRKLFGLTVNVGWKRFHHRMRRGRWHFSFLLWPILNRLVASKVKEKLGGRMRMMVSGGAALPPDIAKTFIGLGVDIVQGYGLTETSPVIAANPLADNIPASVGKALQGVEVRVGEGDELQVRGPGVMLGYWNNHAATSEIIDADGWLHTGDCVRIDDDHLFITGRIKDILVMSNGEKVPPADMESAILMNPLFEQIMIVGEGKSQLAALTVLNQELWFSLAKELQLDPMSEQSLASPELSRHLRTLIAGQLKDFPGYAKIRQVTPILEPWTVDNGLMTPTMKVKRNKVMEHHKADIERMYS